MMTTMIGHELDGAFGPVVITLIRDVSAEFRMSADSFAGIFRDVDEGGIPLYWVAWGQGHAAMAEGRHWDEESTVEDGEEGPYDTLAEAEAYVAIVREAHLQAG